MTRPQQQATAGTAGWRVALAAIAAALLLIGCANRADPAPSVPGTPAAAACTAALLGAAPLYLRGSMNQWTADDAFEFSYRCNAYLLNLSLEGEHRFKIADAAWTDGSVLGGAPGTDAAPSP